MRITSRLGKQFYARDTITVARELLGKLFVRQLPDGKRLAGVIVEVEAYLSAGDLASHSHRGHGASNASMFQSPGTLYVYPIHAKHCLNVVTEPMGVGAAVLIRALEPTEGIETMMRVRGTESPKLLTTGPARLCQALMVDRACDGVNLISSSEVWIEKSPRFVAERVWSQASSARIGISQSVELPLRWFVDGNRYVSGCARDHSCGRNWSFELT